MKILELSNLLESSKDQIRPSVHYGGNDQATQLLSTAFIRPLADPRHYHAARLASEVVRRKSSFTRQHSLFAHRQYLGQSVNYLLAILIM